VAIQARARGSLSDFKNKKRLLFGFSHSSVLSWRTVDILVDDFGNCAFGALLCFACLLTLLPPMLVTGEEWFEEDGRLPDDTNCRLSEFVCNGFLAAFV